MVGVTILAEPIWPFRGHISLMHGWIPVTAQILAVLALVYAIGWRNRRWRQLWLPVAALVGAAFIAVTYWSISSEGLSGEPAPMPLWIWVGLTGLAAGVAALCNAIGASVYLPERSSLEMPRMVVIDADGREVTR